MTIARQRGEPHLEETKRVARILRIVQLIDAEPRRWTRKRLAEEFGRSDRMVANDLEVIRHGLLYDLQSTRGGYYFTDGPMVKPIHLTIAEALALALAAQQARDTGTVDRATAASGLARLEAALPPGIVPYLRQAADSRQPAFGPVRDRAATLAMLERAMVQGRKVRVSYATASRGGAVSERVWGPYALQFYERSWMVIADDSLRNEVRMFKVDRIQQCELTDEAYAVPGDFDVTSYLGTAWGVLRGEAGPAEDVVLRFTPRAAPWVKDERWHWSQETEGVPDGGLIMRFHCSVTHELVRWILSFGPEVCVERPADLRNCVVDEAERVAAVGRLADGDQD
ncbi:MAG: WYL domain-containing transcriptional regulator [Chloroflexi bacterium]|nr:WYL domain-containing transcriptional regulator [Chloroflexota bacterium]